MRERPVKIRAIYPLYPPIRLHSESHAGLYDNFVQEYGSPTSVPVRGSGFHDQEILSVRVLRCSPSLQRELFAHSRFGLHTKHVLEFTGTFKFPGTSKYFVADHNGQVIPEAEERLRFFWLEDLPEYLDLTIQTFLCAAIIAFPGAVYPTGNIWFQGKIKHNFTRYYVSPIHEAIEYLRQNNLHPLTTLNSQKVANWVFGQAGTVSGYSNTPASRALNYFSRLFVPAFREDELSNLVWALAGIEALLVEGGRSSGGQLREKLSALLASPDNLSWLLEMTNSLYNFRSKMVHGNRQIKSAFRVHESEESQKRFDEELNSELFAIGILTVLLQHVINTGVQSFRFKTILDTSRQT